MSDDEHYDDDVEQQEEEPQQQEEEDTQQEEGESFAVPPMESEARPVASLSPTDEGNTKPVKRRQSFASRASRSPSVMEWEDEDREAAHLTEQNAKLKQQIKTMKQTLRGLREGAGGPMSANDEKSADELKAQNEAFEAEIAKWKEKARSVNDLELLDSLMDERTQKQMQVKALEIERRQLIDFRRENAKLLHTSGEAPSRQKVFLDLKDERRRYAKRLDQAQERKEKLAEQIDWIRKKADDAVERVAELHLQNIDYPSVINLQKKSEEQQKSLEKLRSQIAIASSSFETMTTRTVWADRDKQIVLDDIQSQIDKVQKEIDKKEALIMSNSNMTEKPPHFVQPLVIKEDAPKTKPSPRPRPKPKPVEKKEKADDKKIIPHPPKDSKAGAKNKPKPPPKKKTEQPKPAEKEKEEDAASSSSVKTPTPPPQKEDSDRYSDRSPTPPAKSPTPPAKSRTPSPDYDDDYNSPSPAKKDERSPTPPADDDIADDDAPAAADSPVKDEEEDEYKEEPVDDDEPTKAEEDEAVADDDAPAAADEDVEETKDEEVEEPAFLTD